MPYHTIPYCRKYQDSEIDGDDDDEVPSSSKKLKRKQPYKGSSRDDVCMYECKYVLTFAGYCKQPSVFA